MTWRRPPTEGVLERDDVRAELARLAPRDAGIMRRILIGDSVQSIAAAVGLSVGGVYFRRSASLRRLGRDSACARFIPAPATANNSGGRRRQVIYDETTTTGPAVGADPFAKLGRVDIYAETHGACTRLPGRCETRLCRHHLEAREPGERGQNQQRAPLAEPCVLKLIDQHGCITLEAIGDMMRVCRERVRQIETQGRRRFERGLLARGYGPQDVRQVLSAAETETPFDGPPGAG